MNPSSIFIIQMLCLSKDMSDNLRRMRSKTVREKHGHADCEKGERCQICWYTEEPRNIGWWPTQEEAHRICMKYAPWDHLYNYALIEEVPSGVHALGTKVVAFYKKDWELPHDAPESVSKIDIPDRFSNGLTCNFTIG